LDTPPQQITQDFAMTVSGGILKSPDKRPYKNPLFKFIVFVDSNDFEINDIKQVLKETEDKFSPNLICLLDKGVIVKSKILKDGTTYSLGPIDFYPEFVVYGKDKTEFEWVFLEFGDERYRAASNFAFLIFSLNEHLRHCLVLKPEILNYFNNFFSHKGQIIR